MGRRERRLSGGPVAIASAVGGVILPIAARNRVELVLKHSWDKQRIPLLAGKIKIGHPFEVRPGRGKDWREAETRRLATALCELDKGLGKSVGTLQLGI